MPKAAALRLRQHIASGSEGIDEVIESLSQVDSKQAKAWAVEDERKVTLALCGFVVLQCEFSTFLFSLPWC